MVAFPPRNEPNLFFQNLQTLYRDVLRRPQTAVTFVDSEGQNVWLTEYFRFYLNGCSHEEATTRTLTEVTRGGTLPTCGAEILVFPPRNLPNDFQNRLQATYRDVLRRPSTLSFVDNEGANVWLAQYLRFRVAGNCDHASAESRVFTEIRGGGVQPNCTPGNPGPGVNTFQGIWSGNYRIAACTDSGDFRAQGGCTIPGSRVGDINPVVAAFLQTGNRVEGEMELGQYEGRIAGGTVQADRLTGLTGRLTASGESFAIDISAWNTTASGNNLAGGFTFTLTNPRLTGSLILVVQLQNVVRVATAATDGAIPLVRDVLTEGTTTRGEPLAAALRLLNTRRQR